MIVMRTPKGWTGQASRWDKSEGSGEATSAGVRGEIESGDLRIGRAWDA